MGASASLFSAALPKLNTDLVSKAGSDLLKEKPTVGVPVVLGALSASLPALKRKPVAGAEVEDASFFSSAAFPKEKTGADSAGSLLAGSPNFAVESKEGAEVAGSAAGSFPKMGSEVEAAVVAGVEVAGVS